MNWKKFNEMLFTASICEFNKEQLYKIAENNTATWVKWPALLLYKNFSSKEVDVFFDKLHYYIRKAYYTNNIDWELIAKRIESGEETVFETVLFITTAIKDKHDLDEIDIDEEALINYVRAYINSAQFRT